MLQTLNRNCIWTDGIVYGIPTRRILDRRSWCTDLSPLCEQFGDVHRGIPIRIHGETAFTLEDAAIPRTTFATPRTGLGCVSWTDCFDIDAVLPRNALKSDSEDVIGHSFDLSIGLSRKLGAVEMSEILDGNRAIMFTCEIDDLVCDLVASRLGEAGLIAPKPIQCSPSFAGLLGLELRPPYADVAFDLGNIPAEVELPQDVIVNRVEDGDGGKGSDSNINPENVLTLRNFKILLKSYVHNPVAMLLEKLELRKAVAIFKKFVKSLIRSILLNGKPDTTAESGSRYYGIASLGGLKRTRTRDIIGNRNPLKSIVLVIPLSPYIPACILDKLGLKFGFNLNRVIGEVM